MITTASPARFELVEPRTMSKRTLASLSFAIERVASTLGSGALLVSTFQHAPYFAPMLNAYNLLETQGVRCVTAYAGRRFDAQTSEHLELAPTDPLVRVWAAVLVSGHVCAYVVARDLERLAGGSTVLEHGRLFDAEVGFDPTRAVQLVGQIVCTEFGTLSAELTRQIQRTGAAALANPGHLASAALASGIVSLAEHLEATVTTLRAETARAVVDELTGAWNREGLRRWIGEPDQAVPMPPVGVILVDLDGFKRINDTYGHLIGDDVLRRVSAAITGALRRDDIVVRWGGDEFIVLCPGVSTDEALAAVRDTVLRAISTVDVDGRAVAGSAGMQICWHRPLDLVRADEAMYAAKRSKTASI